MKANLEKIDGKYYHKEKFLFWEILYPVTLIKAGKKKWMAVRYGSEKDLTFFGKIKTLLDRLGGRVYNQVRR